MDLYRASNQWATRPPDERFWTIAEAKEACYQNFFNSEEKAVPYSELRVEADGEELRLTARVLSPALNALPPARIGHYAFGQLCQRGNPSAPANFLRRLKPTLAAQVLNSCLKNRTQQDNAHMLFHRTNGDLLLRASLTEKYNRLWNHEIFGRLLELPPGWRVPPARPAMHDPRARPATEADVLSDKWGALSICIGDLIAPAGVYASDHDMFIFMVNEGCQVDEGLSRGFFLWNSEVGDKSFGYCSFLYNHVCGNHIVWGAKGVTEVRVRHVGKVRGRAFRDLQLAMWRYADSSISEDRAKIAEARRFKLGATKEDVVAALLGIAKTKRLVGVLTQKTIDASYDVAEEYRSRYGSPNSLWGMVNGITQYSQETAHADTRNQLDRAAGRLLDVV